MNRSCTKCPVCDAEVASRENLITGEIVECSDCGTELEVTSINPFVLEEAPQEDEDWGQ